MRLVGVAQKVATMKMTMTIKIIIECFLALASAVIISAILSGSAVV